MKLGRSGNRKGCQVGTSGMEGAIIDMGALH